jgi:hypothetical protein
MRIFCVGRNGDSVVAVSGTAPWILIPALVLLLTICPGQSRSAEGTSVISSRGEEIDNHPLLDLGLVAVALERSADRFNKLHDERRWAVVELDKLRAKLDRYKALATSKPDIVEPLERTAYDADLKVLTAQIRTADDAVKASRSEEDVLKARSDLFSLSKRRELLDAAFISSENYRNSMKDWDSAYNENVRNAANAERLQSHIGSLDAAINTLLLATNADNDFKTKISYVFAALVCLVILGFFLIAAFSGAVRTSVFTNDSGLQFVTLFALVIAIILFGVMNILEGRELAALLGGLSGYILGRGAGDANRRSETTPNAQARPPGGPPAETSPPRHTAVEGQGSPAQGATA